MRFRLYNFSATNMNLQLAIKEDANCDIKILSIVKGIDKHDIIQPAECRDFTLKLFAIHTGLIPLSGLIIRNLNSVRDILF